MTLFYFGNSFILIVTEVIRKNRDCCNLHFACIKFIRQNEMLNSILTDFLCSGKYQIRFTQTQQSLSPYDYCTDNAK